MFTEHKQRIDRMLDYSIKKHPDFAVRCLTQTESLPHIQNALAVARAISDAEAKDGYSIQATLNEEVLEVYEAFALGKYEECCDELAQVAAVALRAMDWITQHKLKEANNGKSKSP